MVDIKERPGTSENPYAAFMREGNLELLPTLQKIELMQLLEIFEVVGKWFNNQSPNNHKYLQIIGGTKEELPEAFYFTEDGLSYGDQILGLPQTLALLDSAHLGMGNVAEQLKKQITQRGVNITHAASDLDSIMQLNDSSLEKYDLEKYYFNFYKDWCSIYCVKAEEAEKKNEPEVLDYYKSLLRQFLKEGGFKEYQFRTLVANRPLVAIISGSKKAG